MTRFFFFVRPYIVHTAVYTHLEHTGTIPNVAYKGLFSATQLLQL